MSSHLMSPRLAEWGRPYVRELASAPTDVLVWPTPPTGRATAATAAVLTVGALGGMVVIAQAMASGSISLPVALRPALGAAPHPVTGTPTVSTVEPGLSGSSASESPAGRSDIVGDSEMPAVESSGDYHEWQPPQLTHAANRSRPDAGHRGRGGSAPGHVSPPSRGPGSGTSVAVRRSVGRSTWAGSRDPGAATDGRWDGGRHRATGDDGEQAGSSGYQSTGWHSLGDRGSAEGNSGHDEGGRSPHSGGGAAQGDNPARSESGGGVHGGRGAHGAEVHGGGGVHRA